MQQSPNDKKRYHAITLANGLRVLLVHHNGARKSAAALAINIGHFDDPPHRQGLAHFLEHMLFLGTEKYPDGSEYQNFISEHGGSNNAWTGTEHSCFFFDIAQAYFTTAMERFGQFFTAPLLSEEFVNKERKNIDAEFKLKLKDDIRRLYDVHKETINPKHPFAKFSVGNSKTLADKVGYNLRDEVCDFFQKNYQAHFMTLVLEGPQTLAELEDLARNNFSNIKSNNIAKVGIKQPLYHPEHQQKWINVRPVKNDRQLIISFAMPSIDQFYRHKPEAIIAYLIGHEGPGSILSLLKNKQWAIALTAGSGINGSNFKDFNINISMSELGEKNIISIISIVFSYLNLLKQAPLKAHYYQEKKALADLSFTYQEKLSPINSVSQLVINMQHYPKQDYIFGDYIMAGFNQTIFDQLLRYMTTTNLRLIVISQKVDDLSKINISQWYNVPYSITNISDEHIKQWQQVNNNNELFLPKKNNYITTQPKLITGTFENKNDLLPPKNIFQQQGLNIWFKHDISFNMPKGYIYLAIDSPQVIKNVGNIAMTRLFIELYNDVVAEKYYDAELAGIHYHLYYHQGGMTIQLSGISTKQVSLLSLLLSNLLNCNFCREAFELHKQKLMTRWKNSAKSKSISQLFAKLSTTMQPNSPDNLSLASALEEVNFEHFKDFIAQLFIQVTLEGLIYGNWSRASADEIVSNIKQKFINCSLQKNAIKSPCIDISNQQQITIPMELTDHDHAALLYYPMPDKSLRTVALTMLTNQLLSPIFFQEMRTEKQYGYLVGVGYIPINHYPGIAFYIQSPHTNSYQLTSAMNDFISRTSDYVTNLPMEHWQHLQLGLAGQLQEKYINLRIKSQYYWTTICNQEASFNQKQQLIDTIKSLSITDMVNFIKQHFLGSITDVRLSLLSYENSKQLQQMKSKMLTKN